MRVFPVKAVSGMKLGYLLSSHGMCGTACDSSGVNKCCFAVSTQSRPPREVRIRESCSKEGQEYSPVSFAFHRLPCNARGQALGRKQPLSV